MSQAFSDEFRNRTPTKKYPSRILYASEFTPLRVEDEYDDQEVVLFSLEKSRRRMAAWVVLGALVFGLSIVFGVASGRARKNSEIEDPFSKHPEEGLRQPFEVPGLTYEKIFVMVLQNHGYNDIVTAPGWKDILENSYLLTQYYGVSQETQPNYIAMLNGDAGACPNNKECNLDDYNLVDLLEARGITWLSYLGGYTPLEYGNCNLEMKNVETGYRRVQNPFISFNSVQVSIERCRKITTANQLQQDLQRNYLPQFAFFVPSDLDNCRDTNSAGCAEVMQDWLNNYYYAFPEVWENVLTLVVFDRDDVKEDPTNTNHVAAFFLPGTYTNSGTDDSTATRLDHYSLLRMVEDNFGLGSLGRHDATSPSIELPSAGEGEVVVH